MRHFDDADPGLVHRVINKGYWSRISKPRSGSCSTISVCLLKSSAFASTGPSGRSIRQVPSKFASRSRLGRSRNYEPYLDD